jgi:ABC-type bacteriocin/lantibiotic exporter with double-glycine peptidase domain
MVKIKYYKQETDWTCGAACMVMVLDHFKHRNSEKRVAKLLKTNKVIGTREKAFPELCEQLRLDYVVERRASLNEIKLYLKKNFVVIVRYELIQDRVEHYTVIHSIGKKYMYLHDPILGPDHRLTIPYFRKVWRSKREKELHWFIAIKNPRK